LVIDWELAELGVLPLDIAQMMAEMLELKLFKGIDAGTRLVEGLAAGYGEISEDFAFRAAIHVGAHLVWGCTVPGWGTAEQVDSVMAKGRDIILRAWAKDRSWLEASELACLFRKP
jgi:methanogenic corrinoid protein MtbC1